MPWRQGVKRTVFVTLINSPMPLQLRPCVKLGADNLGVTTQAVLKLANRADLSRINGVGDALSDLLEEASVDTVKELAHPRPKEQMLV